MSEEYKITTGTINGASIKRVDIEPSIIVDGKNYTASEFNKAVEMLKQPQLNENQQIVLEWLKEYMLDDSDFYNTVYASKQLYSYGVPYGEESEAFTKLNNRELAQVLELFSKWAQEQEEKQ